MKKVFTLGSSVLLSMMVLMSCSKDQKVVKQLDGEWKVTQITEDGKSMDLSGAEWTYNFETCKVKKGNCSGSYTLSHQLLGSQTVPFEYSISDKGEKFTMYTEYESGGTTISDTEEFTIEEHSKDKFVISDTDEDGVVTELILEK